MRSEANRSSQLHAAFGQLVVAHRRRLGGMTQAELGRRIGLSRASVTNIEHGRHHVSLEQVYRIAVALQVTPQVLLPSVMQETAASRMAEILPPGLEEELVEWADSL